jgi:glycosyltransferase involved in cell wall biosynthesis
VAPAPELSVVIPIYNEAPNLEPLYREFTDTLTAWGHPYELIFVDDGSIDESFAILEKLQARDRNVRVVQFGATSARRRRCRIRAGSGTADCDRRRRLQNDPHDIPARQPYRPGFDIVWLAEGAQGSTAPGACRPRWRIG